MEQAWKHLGWLLKRNFVKDINTIRNCVELKGKSGRKQAPPRREAVPKDLNFSLYYRGHFRAHVHTEVSSMAPVPGSGLLFLFLIHTLGLL